MHTMQYVATLVELDEPTDLDEVKEIAKAQVADWLNEWSDENGFVGGWSDWSMVGGRWDEVPILAYTDDTACEFLEALDMVDKVQRDGFNEYLAEFDYPTIHSLMTRYGAGEQLDNGDIYKANVYSLYQALRILKGYWSYDSKFFDSINNTPQTNYLRKTLLETIDKPDPLVVYCLVPVDFHF
jgi:hypothetical protein